MNEEYDKFVENYRAFCDVKGRLLDSLPVNLTQLFALATKHGNLNSSTPGHVWDKASQSITGGFLPGHILKEQYCTYLEGFDAFVVSVNKEHATPLSSKQQTSQQQSPAPNQLVPAIGQEAAQQRARPPQQRTKLPKQQILLQELQRRRAAAATAVGGVAVPAAASATRGNSPPVALAHQHSVDAACSSEPAPVTATTVKPTDKLPPKLVMPVAPPTAKCAAQRPAHAPAAAPAGARKSGRARNQAGHMGYVDSGLIRTSSSSSFSDGSDLNTTSNSSDADAEDSYDTSHSSSSSPWTLGPDFQAVLPPLKQRPAGGPTASEAKYLSKPVYTPIMRSSTEYHSQQLQDLGPSCRSSSSDSTATPGAALWPGIFHSLWCKAGFGPARVQLLQQWLADMDAHMGHQLAQALGLGLLGFKLRAGWSAPEEILFALGMLDNYRNFRHIRRYYLPRRSVHELNGYYYNVWKNRAGPVPEEFAVLNDTPQGDGPAWRLDLCRRLSGMWDHEQMGPIPKMALPDLPAAEAAAAGLQVSAVPANASIRRPPVSRSSSEVPGTGTAAVAGVKVAAAGRPGACKPLASKSQGRESLKAAGRAGHKRRAASIDTPEQPSSGSSSRGSSSCSGTSSNGGSGNGSRSAAAVCSRGAVTAGGGPGCRGDANPSNPVKLAAAAVGQQQQPVQTTALNTKQSVNDFLRFLRQATTDVTGEPAVKPLQPLLPAASPSAAATQAEAAAVLQAMPKRQHPSQQQLGAAASVQQKSKGQAVQQQEQQQQQQQQHRKDDQQHTANDRACMSQQLSQQPPPETITPVEKQRHGSEGIDGAAPTGGAAGSAGRKRTAATVGSSRSSSNDEGFIGKHRGSLKRRASCEEEGSHGPGPMWVEDNDGVICISD